MRARVHRASGLLVIYLSGLLLVGTWGPSWHGWAGFAVRLGYYLTGVATGLWIGLPALPKKNRASALPESWKDL